jgi:hypothetical protein
VVFLLLEWDVGQATGCEMKGIMVSDRNLDMRWGLDVGSGSEYNEFNVPGLRS